jgi:ribosomal protein S18 acetylase RimI-like enzyme
MTDIQIVPLARTHLPSVKAIIRAVELFPEDMLDEMVTNYLNGNPKNEVWLVAEGIGPLGIVYCTPEYLTSGTANMLLLAVHPDHHRKAIGRQLVQTIESHFQKLQFHLLIVETSGAPEFGRVREFYDQLGFQEEAKIRDFYAIGDDKVIMTKHIK